MEKQEKTNKNFIDNVAVNVCFFFVVQKVMAHVNNVVLHNLHKYKIYIIWTQILMQRHKTFRCELKKKERNHKLSNFCVGYGCNTEHGHSLCACAVRTASGAQCSGFSLARKDAIIGILTNNTRIHHSHGNINHSDTRHLQLSARVQNMALCIKEITIFLLFSCQLCLACYEGHKWGLDAFRCCCFELFVS